MLVKIKTKDNTVLIPKFQTKGAAGMDISAHSYCYPYEYPYDLKTEYNFTYEEKSTIIHLQPGERVLIKTGLFVEIPEGYEAQVRPRSGLALKHGITIVNSPGTIDSDFRGEIGVILLNTGEDSFDIKKGDRIAQLVFTKVEQPELVLENDLSETERSDGGFGSTNK